MDKEEAKKQAEVLEQYYSMGYRKMSKSEFRNYISRRKGEQYA